ncbi:MAG TPA: PHB depolymerase family esterase [Kofleriaceae bacterium]|nr:PHB depolymerase family esterase [Kofleriaceae bacterium]
MPGPGPGPGMTGALTCDTKVAQPLDQDLTLMVGGVERRYQLHVPASYDPHQATPVVLNFHGLGSNATQQKFFSRMIDKSDAEGFIAVHPDGTGTGRQSWNGAGCCDAALANDVDDVGFVAAILDAVEKELCVDTRRVYATGMSNGGFMSHRLACDLSARITAIAPVAGVNAMGDSCKPARAVPMMQFHGTMDMLVPYDGMPQYGFPPVVKMFGDWAKRDACTDGTPKETFKKDDTTCQSYTACGNGAEVILCTVDGGGHTWPGGIPVASLGKTTDAISATDAMWTFFMRHQLPAK